MFGIRSGYESVEYKVVDSIDSIEIRKYPARVAAEASAMKDNNEAFMSLFGYISAKNNTNQSLAMTTPVETSKTADNTVSMRFFLPHTFTVDSAPKPDEPRIHIMNLPEETYAVATYSGFNTDERFRSESDRLIKAIARTKWKPVSAVSFLGYDPPFAIPFLRRNEAIVKVEAQ